jgi:tetratricopeptide (TPR) repeat protein
MLSKIYEEHSYNPQAEELLVLYKKIASNLSLCYSKIEKYEESIELDLKIISYDKTFDKAYVRLFNNYLNFGKKEQALYFGDMLLKFDDETKKKYEKENIITKIIDLKNEFQAAYEKRKAKERKDMLKSIAKYVIPLIVLVIGIFLYLFVFKKEQVQTSITPPSLNKTLDNSTINTSQNQTESS